MPIIGTALYVGNFTIEEALVAASCPDRPRRKRTAMSTAPADSFRPGRIRLGPPDRFAAQRLDGRLRDLLAGKKIVMTGVTGFIGEQLLWKILTELPGHHARRCWSAARARRRPGTG